MPSLREHLRCLRVIGRAWLEGMDALKHEHLVEENTTL